VSDTLQVELRPQHAQLTAGRETNLNVMVQVNPAAAPGRRLPLNICVLLDISGTMRRFELTEEDVARWEELARSRGELLLKRVDRQQGVIFTGATLRELQEAAKKPLDLAVLAIKRVSGKLAEGDRLSLVVFANRAAVAYDGSERLDKGKLFEALNRVQSDPAQFAVGDGTHAAQGVRLAAQMLAKQASSAVVSRALILTDGIVQDRGPTLGGLDMLRRQNVSTTTVGIGQDFDEEFLAKAADSSGGEYYFAAAPGAVADHLSEETAQMQAVVARQLQVSTTGRDGARVVDVHQLRPRLRIFEEVITEGGITTVQVGDLQAGRKTALMVELALPPYPAGESKVAQVVVRWVEPGEDTPREAAADLALTFGAEDSPVDQEVADLAVRLAVYKAEREAQWAQEDGDLTLATRKLRQATRALTELGEKDLAAQFEQQAAALEANQQLDPRRTKSLKQATRRLTQQ